MGMWGCGGDAFGGFENCDGEEGGRAMESWVEKGGVLGAGIFLGFSSWSRVSLETSVFR